MTAVAPVEMIRPAGTDGYRDRQELTHCGRSANDAELSSFVRNALFLNPSSYSPAFVLGRL